MKELAVFALAYDLVVSVMAESARVRKVPVDRISLIDALRWLTHPNPDVDPGDILVNPPRPNRVEPRVIKRRMKEFPLMKEPRSTLRNRLLQKRLRLKFTPFISVPFFSPRLFLARDLKCLFILRWE